MHRSALVMKMRLFLPMCVSWIKAYLVVHNMQFSWFRPVDLENSKACLCVIRSDDKETLKVKLNSCKGENKQQLKINYR